MTSTDQEKFTKNRETLRKIKDKIDSYQGRDICPSIILRLLATPSYKDIVRTAIFSELINLRNESLAKYGRHLLDKQLIDIDQQFIKYRIDEIKLFDELLALLTSYDLDTSQF